MSQRPPRQIPIAAGDTNGPQARVVIDRVTPSLDSGAFAIKRVLGESVKVEADILADGHDVVSAELLHRAERSRSWQLHPMEQDVNDRWHARFEPTALGRWEYTIEAWIDRFATWRDELKKKAEAGRRLDVELLVGAELVQEAAEAAENSCSEQLIAIADRLSTSADQSERVVLGLSEHLHHMMRKHAPRRHLTTLAKPLPLVVDRVRALYGAWYELFPRSCSPEPGVHGTFDDVITRVPYVAGMGFDVLYLPPIHPIGTTGRKGRNNTTAAEAGDVGSPWAIGSEEGGHTSVHPQLGTLDDFDRLVGACRTHGIEVALDIAFQCSPDHPWTREHPEWFRRLPDGTIRTAENPPKRYEDIYPIDFETEAWEPLWNALRNVFLFWVQHGVCAFRVDNPHTKSFRFWDWVIAEVQRAHPDVIFLAEAFTRPKRMLRLAKGGFSQSYTYFAWRNSPYELAEYMRELTRTEATEFFRPNFWPNTPDILTEALQHGGPAMATVRVILAGTLSASYGIYGPVYELCDFSPRPGAEENLDSEKYQLRHWNLEDPRSLRHVIARLNRIRREHPALQQNRLIDFHPVDNPMLLAYSKRSPHGDDIILCVVSTDPHHDQWGTVSLDQAALGVEHDAEFEVHDLLSERRYLWRGSHPVVGLGPARGMAHIFHVRRRRRSELDFDYFQ